MPHALLDADFHFPTYPQSSVRFFPIPLLSNMDTDVEMATPPDAGNGHPVSRLRPDLATTSTLHSGQVTQSDVHIVPSPLLDHDVDMNAPPKPDERKDDSDDSDWGLSDADQDDDKEHRHMGTNPNAMRIRGCLADLGDDCLLQHSEWNKQLSSLTGFLGDETVSVLMSHYSLGLYSTLQKELTVISTCRYVAWRDRQARIKKAAAAAGQARKGDGAPLEPEREFWLRWVDRWKTRRFLAFIGHENAHFTLGIVYNRAWVAKSTKNGTENRDWCLYHFDSAPPSRLNVSNAKEFAAAAVGVSLEEMLFVEVPVPTQPPGSNACGLCAPHYFRTFFVHWEKTIKFCDESADRGYFRNSDIVLKHWESHRLLLLRREALKICTYYKDMHLAGLGQSVSPAPAW